MLVDATEIRKNVKYGTKLKDALNEADILLMKSYFKPKFNTREENVVNRKLCGRTMKVYKSMIQVLGFWPTRSLKIGRPALS